MRDAPLFPVLCMDALMPRAHGCAGAATQGYFLLLVQEKVAKENDTPDGATQPCAPQALGPAPARRDFHRFAVLLRDESPGHALHGVPARRGAGPPDHRLSNRLALSRGPVARIPARDPFGALSQSPAVLGFAPYGDPKKTTHLRSELPLP